MAEGVELLVLQGHPEVGELVRMNADFQPQREISIMVEAHPRPVGIENPLTNPLVIHEVVVEVMPIPEVGEVDLLLIVLDHARIQICQNGPTRMFQRLQNLVEVCM